jgi:hypothetical protein
MKIRHRTPRRGERASLHRGPTLQEQGLLIGEKRLREARDLHATIVTCGAARSQYSIETPIVVPPTQIQIIQTVVLSGQAGQVATQGDIDGWV